MEKPPRPAPPNEPPTRRPRRAAAAAAAVGLVAGGISGFAVGRATAPDPFPRDGGIVREADTVLQTVEKVYDVPDYIGLPKVINEWADQVHEGATVTTADLSFSTGDGLFLWFAPQVIVPDASVGSDGNAAVRLKPGVTLNVSDAILVEGEPKDPSKPISKWYFAINADKYRIKDKDGNYYKGYIFLNRADLPTDYELDLKEGVNITSFNDDGFYLSGEASLGLVTAQKAHGLPVAQRDSSGKRVRTELSRAMKGISTK